MADEEKPSGRLKKLMQELEHAGLRVRNLYPEIKSIGFVGGVAQHQNNESENQSESGIALAPN